MVQRRRRRPSSPLYRDYLIYVSGAYEKAYMQALHGLLREKWNVNLHCEEYRGGADFHSGIAALKKDLQFKRTKSITKNIEKSEIIFIQGDMDVEKITRQLALFEQDLKKIDSRCELIPSVRCFESWLKAHFVTILNEKESVTKQDIDAYITGYSKGVDVAKKYFDRSLAWPMIERATNSKTGNCSFHDFIEQVRPK